MNLLVTLPYVQQNFKIFVYLNLCNVAKLHKLDAITK